MTPAPRWISDDAIDRLREAAELPDLSATKYELLERLAHGGMGTIWLARDVELDRQVAIKVLSTPNADPGLAQRMLLEARVLARLEHPGIVPVHDVGALPDGRIFYVMKQVRGRSLERHPVLRAPLPERLRVMERICEAAAYAHDRGVVHRDLKPENIMVGEFGEVLIMDWGVAKILEGGRAPGTQGARGADGAGSRDRGTAGKHTGTGSSLPERGHVSVRDGADGRKTPNGAARDQGQPTEVEITSDAAREIGLAEAQGRGSIPAPGAGTPRTSDPVASGAEGATTLPAAFTGHGSVLGTPAWMAPEQARGEVERIDARADIYSLGAILHFLLVGEPPSDARTPAEAITRFEGGATGSPRKKSSSVPKALDAVCRRAMAQEPAERYAIAGDLGKEIALYLAGLPPREHREGILERAGRWARNYRTAILLVVAYLAMRVALFFWLGR